MAGHQLTLLLDIHGCRGQRDRRDVVSDTIPDGGPPGLAMTSLSVGNGWRVEADAQRPPRWLFILQLHGSSSSPSWSPSPSLIPSLS